MRSHYKNKIAQSFGRHHDYYAKKATLQKQVARDLAAHLPPLKAPRILEIGCGTGFLTAHLFNLYPDGVFDITDLSAPMVAHCKTHHAHPNARYHVMDGEALSPSLRPSYDLIVSAMAVQWFETPLQSLSALQKLGPIYYATLGNQSFLEWRTCLDALDLPDGTMHVPDWEGVIDDQLIPIPYKSGYHFLKALKNIGTAVPHQTHTPLSVKNMRQALKAFDEAHHRHVTWHIVYGHLPGV